MKNNAPTLFTFIDLFAGIGGFRLAFEPVAGQCVFASEWDKFSQQTYEANFGHKPAGDITQIRSEDIPDHDILTGGFPCQPFSSAGVTKHNALGNSHGFQHPTQGTLFFEIVYLLCRVKTFNHFLGNGLNNRHRNGITKLSISSSITNNNLKCLWKT